MPKCYLIGYMNTMQRNEIAKLFNVSRSVIQKILNERGIKK
jgi:transposase